MLLPTYQMYIYHQYLVCDARYKMTLGEFERRKRDRRIPRVALKHYSTSPFEYLYNSLNDQALLNATGCDHRAFMVPFC